jgi:1,4-alpha-glucan branching enzyme
MLAVHALIGLAAVMPAAAHDNNVEWSGISHVDPWDRDPYVPVDGEPFTLYFQTYDFDLTSARLYWDDGSPHWVDASYSHDRGIYDVWEAVIPCTAPNAVISYYFELTDGSDVDYIGPIGLSDNAPASGWTINFNTYLHAPLGSTPLADGGAVFKVWGGAGGATCSVAGTFNGWNAATNPMVKNGEIFTARINSVPVGSQYKYVFNGTTWKSDARGRRLNSGDNYNTYLVDPTSYVWTTPPTFPMTSFEDAVIYQLHVGTYAGRNDGNNFGTSPATYRSIVDTHLQHIVDLGVNVVQLMPVTEFPTDWSAGYNPISQFALEWKSGTPDDFKYMVDKFHAAGIAVTLDIVWNHFSGSDNFLWLYSGTGDPGQIYFDGDGATGQFETPWGSQADFDSLDVRNYFADSARMWMEEYRLDGFRMDATDYMNPPNGQGPGWGLMQRFNNEADQRNRDHLLYAEQLPDDYYVTRLTSQGGAGFDSQYHDRYKWALRNAVFAAASGTPNINELRASILGGLNDSHNIYSEGQTGTQLVRYWELHDETWASSGHERAVNTIDTTAPHDDQYARGRTLYAHAVTMFSPGIPAFFMGAEFLEDTNFGTSNGNRIDWSKATTYANYLQAFKDMIRIKHENPGFRSNAGVQVNHSNESLDILTIHRWDGSGNDLLVVASLSNGDQSNYRIGFPQGGFWNEIYNTQSASYGGSGVGNFGGITANQGAYDGYPQSAFITIPARSVTVFRFETCTNNGQCDDGIGCTTDACVQGACRNTPNTALCPDDGVFCNGEEFCEEGAGCVSTGNPCPPRSCNEGDAVCEFESENPSYILAELTACLAGPGQSPDPQNSTACSQSCLDRYDFDGDFDVDLADFSLYQLTANVEITSFVGDATGWLNAANGEASYAFDSFVPGLAFGAGALTPASTTLNLPVGVSLTITDSTGTGALYDNVSRPQLSDALIGAVGTSKWEFSQPIYGLYTFVAAMDSGITAKMTLYKGGSPLGSITRDNAGSTTLAAGMGFISNIGVDRIDFTVVGPDTQVLIGANNGINGAQSNLGTITIPGYSGPTGTTVQLDFAVTTTP